MLGVAGDVERDRVAEAWQHHRLEIGGTERAADPTRAEARGQLDTRGDDRDQERRLVREERTKAIPLGLDDEPAFVLLPAAESKSLPRPGS